ncbi:hypothetical protein K502DRAFT_364535 [Neoconidiobolus thromboides FSU 785]|nr:hypothetical protein K502DRAFT_364535 [Neoconidiobolus thromboides FSU 785]
MKFLWTVLVTIFTVSAQLRKRECADHSRDCCGLQCKNSLSASEKCCDQVEGIMAPEWCLGLKRNGKNYKAYKKCCDKAGWDKPMADLLF